MTQIPELKPCPFCGGKAKFNFFLGKPCVTCTNCMGGVFPALGNTKEIAAKDWNKRVQQCLKNYAAPICGKNVSL